MLPVVAGALIAGGASLVSGVGNWISQARTNRQNRELALEQQQRDIANNERQWKMQNEYNTPAAQMERLQSAGLNPNMVYGKGADNIAGSISSSRSTPVRYDAPKVPDLADSFNNYQNYALRQAQMDNLTSQNTVILQEALYKAAQTASVIQSTAKSKFELDMASELRKVTMDVAGENLRKLQYENVYNIEKTEQLVAIRESNIQKAALDVLNLRLS